MIARRRTADFALIASSAVFASPEATSAARNATPTERAAILADVKPRYEYCFAVGISTADASWGLFTTQTPRPVGCDAVGDGFALVHQDRTGAWSTVLENAGDQGTCRQAGISTPVGVDLKVFRPVPRAKTTITCLPRKRAHAVRRP
jgi:hypothetical protein